MSVVRTVPAGAVAAGLVATGGDAAGTTALSVVSLLAMLLVLRSARFHLHEPTSPVGRHRRDEPR